MSRAARAGGFSPATMIAVVLVGVLSMAGLGLLAAFAPELKSGDDGREHALSRSSVGFAAIRRLLEADGARVLTSRGPLSETAAESLQVITPSVETPAARVADVASESYRNVIVLPKWQAGLDPRHRGWVRTLGVHDLSAVTRPLPPKLVAGTLVARRKGAAPVRLSRPNGTPFATLPAVETLQTVSGPSWVPVLVDETGAAVLAMHKDSDIYVLADPDLLNTQGMKTLAGASAAVRLLALIRAEDTPVIFDLTLHGFARSRSLPRLLLEPPLLGVTLCLLGAALLAGVQAAVRFGPPRDRDRAVALGKRALADNTAGLVRLARREHRMAAPYALLVRAAVARAIGAPRKLSGAELDAFLDRLGQVGGLSPRYSDLAARAEAARTPADLMQVARDLYRWKLEMTHERR